MISAEPSPSLILDKHPTAAAVAAVEGQCFGVSWSVQEVERLLSNPAVGAWIVRQSRLDVAMICFQMTEDEAEIYRIGVLPGRRGKGFGRRLMVEYLSEAKRRGCKRVFLEVREGNIPAVELYRSLGFQVSARRKNYYAGPPEDGLVMELRVAPEKRAPSVRPRAHHVPGIRL
jgi:ribosomal-protein-alanine N-acetyltransferase